MGTNEVNVSQDQMAAIGGFLSYVRHEVRTPLGAVIGGASLLSAAAQNGTEEDRDRYYEMIKRGANKIDELVTDLADFGSAASGRMKIEKRAITIAPFLDDLQADCRRAVDGRSIEIRFSVAEGLAQEFDSDCLRLRQAVRCLVAAAAGRMASGSIEVAIRGVFSNQSMTDVLIEVLDDGPRVDLSMDPCEVSGGFYLPLAKAILNQLDYRFEIVPGVSGVGNVCTVRLPLLANSVGQCSGHIRNDASPAPENKSRCLEGVRILVADDSNDNKILLNYFLTSVGAIIETASDGRTALEMALINDYDLVLMDLYMPAMDGHQATVELRRMGYSRPVIALTAHAGSSEVAACMQEGFSDCIERPVTKTVLFSRISEALKRA